MQWIEARDKTLEQWTAIQESVGTADPLELLADVNAVTAICEKAKEEAGGGLDRCDYCIIYQQFGGCKEFGARISEKVADKDWPGVRTMVGSAIHVLKHVEIPPEGGAA